MVISTERVNCYGSWVSTNGIEIEQFKRNPVLLYMHQRWGRDTMPIGRVDDVHIEGERLLGTLVFDENDPDGKKIADKWDNGFLRMVSPCLDIIETSDAPELRKFGQTRMTVTKSKLVEVSVVDMGANDDALPLMFSRKGRVLKLSAMDDCPDLPLLSEDIEKQNDKPKEKTMRKVLLALGLPESATEEQAEVAVLNMKKRAADADAVVLAAIDSAVRAAIENKVITADKKEHFVSLGKTSGLQVLNDTLALMKPAHKPTDFIDRSGDKKDLELAWGDLTPESAAKLKKEDPKKYALLYKKEFGIDYKE